MGKYKFLYFLVLIIFGFSAVFLPDYFQNRNKKENTDSLNYFLSRQFGGVLVTLGKNIVDPLLLNEKPTLGKVVSELRKIEGIKEVLITDMEGKVFVSSLPEYEEKSLKEAIGIDVNLGEFTQINISKDKSLYFVRAPIKFEAGNKEKVIGNLVIGIDKNVVSDLFTQTTGSYLKYMPNLLILLGLIIIGFILGHFMIFAPIQRKIEIYEARQRRYITFEALKKAEEEAKESINKLEEKKRELEEELARLREEIESKKREVEETDIAKIVRELEAKKIELEENLVRLKREEEEVKKNLASAKMEQEELKKRLDIIRKKMKQMLGE